MRFAGRRIAAIQFVRPTANPKLGTLLCHRLFTSPESRPLRSSANILRVGPELLPAFWVLPKKSGPVEGRATANGRSKWLRPANLRFELL